MPYEDGRCVMWNDGRRYPEILGEASCNACFAEVHGREKLADALLSGLSALFVITWRAPPGGLLAVVGARLASAEVSPQGKGPA